MYIIFLNVSAFLAEKVMRELPIVFYLLSEYFANIFSGKTPKILESRYLQ